AQQFDEPLLFLQRLKKLLQSLPVLFARNQVRRALDENYLCGIVAGENSLLVKLLYRLHQSVVLVALSFEPSRDFAADGFQSPTAEIFIDESRRGVEIGLRQIKPEQPVAHQAR